MSARSLMVHDHEVTLGPTCWQTVTACLHHWTRLGTSSSEQHQPLCTPPLVTIPDTAAPGAYTPPQPSQPLWMSPGSQHSSSALSSLSVTDSLSQGTHNDDY